MAKVKNTNSNKSFSLFIIAAIMLVMFAGVFMKGRSDTTNSDSNETEAQEAQVSEAGDLIIPIDKISSKANFYKYDANGTELEVIAIKASDGTIRTAFNTCQVCFSSGRGYYVQEGDKLVCQNCGNRFAADDVEVTKGGCNPVPIFTEDKTVNDETIVISKEYLESAKELFAKWKS